MAGRQDHKVATQHTCVDKSLELILGSGGSTNGKFFIQLKHIVITSFLVVIKNSLV